jgi:hypothetical protein
MENFVPPKIKEMLEGLIRHNKADNTYSMLPITSVTFPRPPVDRGVVLPLFSKGPGRKVHPSWNLYYTDENILQLHLDGPRPSTTLYTPPDTDPCISSMLQRALEEAEAEVLIDCTRFSAKRRRYVLRRLDLEACVPQPSALASSAPHMRYI